MIRTILSAALLLGISNGAYARYIGPILVKEGSTGFTLPEYTKSEKCEIFADRTVITTKFGATNQVVSVRTLNQTLEGGMFELLRKANRTKLDNVNGPVDGPSTSYYGFIINANDTVKKVTIYDENGSSGIIRVNPSADATALKIVIEALCPNTLQGFGPPPAE